MTSTNAERQKRFRLHRRGDHSLCSDERCGLDEGVTPSNVTRYDPKMPSRLLTRGRRVWEGLGGPDEAMPADERLLVEEIARCADRLEKLDRTLTDERHWLTFRRLSEDASIVTVRVDGALAEARQSLTAMKGAIAELRTMRAGKPARRGAGGQVRQSGVGAEPVKEVPAGVGDLAARIAARRTAPTG